MYAFTRRKKYQRSLPNSCHWLQQQEKWIVLKTKPFLKLAEGWAQLPAAAVAVLLLPSLSSSRQLPGRCCGQHADCSLALRPRPCPLSAFPFPTELSCRDPLAVPFEVAASEGRPPQTPKSRLQGISYNLIFPIGTTKEKELPFAFESCLLLEQAFFNITLESLCAPELR